MSKNKWLLIISLILVSSIVVPTIWYYSRGLGNGNSHESTESIEPTPIDKTLDINSNGIPDYLENSLDDDYVAFLVGLEDYELNALIQRVEKGENLTTGDFDRDGVANEDEMASIFDPSNSQTELDIETLDFIEKLVEYHDGHNQEKTTTAVYSSEALQKALDLIEARPQIASDLNSFGADALPRILDYKNIEEILGNVRYQLFLHAMTVKAQDFFYDIENGIYWKWGGPNEGKMANEKLDPEEMEILDQRWQDRDIILADGERRIENIGERILNLVWFSIDAETGFESTQFNFEDTDSYIEVAKKNARVCSRVREEISKVIDDTTQRDYLIERYYNFMDLEAWGESGQRFREYWNIIINEGEDSDITLLALVGYTHNVKPAVHEIYVEASKLFASFFGESIYRSDGWMPFTGTEHDGAPDGKPAPVFSDKAMEAISRIGYPTVDEETGALPIIYGVEEEILNADKVSSVEIEKDTGITILCENK